MEISWNMAISLLQFTFFFFFQQIELEYELGSDTALGYCLWHGAAHFSWKTFSKNEAGRKVA